MSEAAPKSSNVFDSLIETEAEEVARLTKSPVGSLNHHLSSAPVNIHEYLHGIVVKLTDPDDGRTMVVVPVEQTNSEQLFAEDGIRRRRHGGHWKCIVVDSQISSYKVGGYDLSIPEAQLVRGERVTF